MNQFAAALKDRMQMKISKNTNTVCANEVTILLFEQLHDIMMYTLFESILTVTKIRLLM